MPAMVTRASASATVADAMIWPVSRCSCSARKPIESRALAFPLTSAQNLDQPFHLAQLGPCGVEACLPGDYPSGGGSSIGPQQPQPQVAVGLCGGGRRNAGVRQGVTGAEQRQQLLRLEEFGEAGSLAAVQNGWIRIGDAGELFAARHLRLRADGPGPRSIPHDLLYDFALGSVLASRQRWRQQAGRSDPGTGPGSGRHTNGP